MNTRKRLYTLDAIRGIAALLVVLYHYGGEVSRQFVSFGYLAVDIFFVLSGCVLVQAYTDRLNNGDTFRSFMKNRFIRLYPLYAAGTFLGLAMKGVELLTHDSRALSLGSFVQTAVLSPLMLPSRFGEDSLFPFNLPAWSLFLEMILSAAFALGMFRVRARALFAIAGMGLLVHCAGHLTGGDLSDGWNGITLPGGIGRAFFAFSLGILIAQRSPMTPKSSWASIPFLLLVGISLVVPLPEHLKLTYELAMTVVGAPAIVYWGTKMDPPAVLRPLFSFLGDISYPLYAIHFPLMIVFVAVGRYFHWGIPLTGCFTVVGATSLAMLAGYYFDAPARAWLGKTLALGRLVPVPAL